MKSESLVTVSQHITVNTFPGLVHTARQATEVRGTRSGLSKELPKVNLITGVKS